MYLIWCAYIELLLFSGSVSPIPMYSLIVSIKHHLPYVHRNATKGFVCSLLTSLFMMQMFTCIAF